jgi:signal transduction histidine kinase
MSSRVITLPRPRGRRPLADDHTHQALPILHGLWYHFIDTRNNIRHPNNKALKTHLPAVKKRSSITASASASGRKKSGKVGKSVRRKGDRRATSKDRRALLETDFDPRMLLRPDRDAAGRVVDFIIAEVNEAACTECRLARAQLAGQSLTKVLPNTTPSGLFEMYCRVLESQETLELPAFAYQHDIHGDERVYQIRVVPVGDELSYTWRDVTEGADTPSPARPLAMERRKNRSIPDEARAQIRELETLVQELLRSKEEQEQVISRELHDNIAQVLNAATNRIALARDEKIPAWLRQELQDLRGHLEGALSDVRTLARELRPALLDHFGFAAALAKHADDFRQRTNLTLDLQLQPETVSFLGTDDLTHLFRLTQEALQNIEEHSGADRAWIRLAQNDGHIVLEIGDDGCSFPPERVTEAQANGHLGLLGMRERAELLGGQLVLQAVPEQGTTIHVTIPPPQTHP